MSSVSTCMRAAGVNTTTSEMTPYFTMTKCNKLSISYLTCSTERYTNSSIQYFNHFKDILMMVVITTLCNTSVRCSMKYKV